MLLGDSARQPCLAETGEKKKKKLLAAQHNGPQSTF